MLKYKWLDWPLEWKFCQVLAEGARGGITAEKRFGLG